MGELRRKPARLVRLAFIAALLLVAQLPLLLEPATAQSTCRTSAVVEWTGAGSNGHSYRAVCETGTWEEARAAAAKAGGYLATITSADENAFLFNLIEDESWWTVNSFNAAIGPFVGGLQTQPCGSEPAGCWGWVTGEPFTFTAWSGGEPSNSGNTEHYLHFYGCCGGLASRGPVWNDISNDIGTASNGYIIEFEPEEPARIYWSNYGTNASGSTIGRANVDGSNVNQSFITGADGPVGVHVTDSHIYWANAGDQSCSGTTIGRANVDGSNVNQSFITGVQCAHGVASNSSHIFWANRGRNGSGSTIGRANLDGTAVDNNFITGAAGPHGLVINDTHVFWANYNNGTIGRANLDGSGVNQTFITVTGSPTGMEVTDSYLYWTNQAGTNIGRANLDGTGVDNNLITSASNPQYIDSNASHLFWANFGAPSAAGAGTTLGRANLDGTGVNQSFITGANAPVGVAVTGTVPAPCIRNPDAVCTTDDDDTVTGTARADVIYTFGGADSVFAGAGDDFVNAGAGNDLIRGDAGRAPNRRAATREAAGEDRLLGAAGRDRIFGELGDDFLNGGGGNDVLNAAEGRDLLKGGPGRDVCYGERKDRYRSCEVIRFRRNFG